jgi:hypothetical protein
MSRGPGRIERAIAAILDAEPDNAFTTEDFHSPPEDFAMTRIIASPFTASVLALGLAATSADAQNRVFVGRNGDDANPCTVVAPCRTFQRAHDVVAANGEIDVLDPAGYSKLIITKAISIQGHAFAGIISTSGDAITINAGVNDKINLRGLHIDGVGTGAYGIHFNSGASLNVQDCLIRNFANGLVFAPSNALHTATLTTVHFSMSNSLVSDSAGFGIAIQPLVGVVRAVLDHVEMDNNENGLLVQRNDVPVDIFVTLSSSVAANNSKRGIWALSQGSGSGVVYVMVRNSTITNNNSGMEVFGNHAIMWVSHSTIALNGGGVGAADGGVIESFGDNVLKGNGIDGLLTSTTALK